MQRRRCLATLAMVLLAAPASAHAILLESEPAHGARIAAGERGLNLRFNSRLDHARSRLTLIHPDKRAEVLALAEGPDNLLAANTILAPGGHVLRWQVLAIDGHITRGELPFSVQAP